jgi:hypothetical protein
MSPKAADSWSLWSLGFRKLNAEEVLSFVFLNVFTEQTYCLENLCSKMLCVPKVGSERFIIVK